MSYERSDAFDYVQGRLSPEDMRRFQESLEQQPELRSAVDDAKKVLDTIAQAREATEALSGQVILRAVKREGAGAVPESAPVRWFVPALAALSLAVVGAVLNLEQEPAYTPLWAYLPPPGVEGVETVWIPLGDGSRVSPSAEAIWSLDTQKDEQIALTLESGSLECDVSKRPEREFVVRTKGLQVTVKGTRFKVGVAQNRGTVEVLEGLVAVLREGEEILLEAGQSFRDSAGRTAGSTGPRASDGAGEDSAPTAAPQEKAIPAEFSASREPHSGRVPRGGEGPAKPANGEGNRADVEPLKEQHAVVQPIAIVPEPDQGIPASTQSHSDIPPDPAIRASLRDLAGLIQRGDCEGYFAARKSVHPSHPYQQADLLYLEGYCHHVAERKEEAVAAWRKMESLDAENPWLRTVGDWLNPTPPKPEKIR